ncbi:hypothetical protein V2J09_022756 [Rumex salicifolius]
MSIPFYIIQATYLTRFCQNLIELGSPSYASAQHNHSCKTRMKNVARAECSLVSLFAKVLFMEPNSSKRGCVLPLATRLQRYYGIIHGLMKDPLVTKSDPNELIDATAQARALHFLYLLAHNNISGTQIEPNDTCPGTLFVHAATGKKLVCMPFVIALRSDKYGWLWAKTPPPKIISSPSLASSFVCGLTLD